MSRIGILPIDLPAGVSTEVSSDNLVTVKGPKGELQQQVDKNITVKVEENQSICFQVHRGEGSQIEARIVPLTFEQHGFGCYRRIYHSAGAGGCWIQGRSKGQQPPGAESWVFA